MTYEASFDGERIDVHMLPLPNPGEHLTDDPVADNTLRAKWAAVGVLHFAETTGVAEEDPAVAITDLLCNMRHLCDAVGLDWQDRLDAADRHYEEEVRGG